MERKIIYRDSDGVRRTSITDEEYPGRVVVHTEVDVEQALKNNHILRELHPRRSTNKLLARGVPLTIWEQSLREQWSDADWKRWLNDPDNAAFRVWPGRV